MKYIAQHISALCSKLLLIAGGIITLQGCDTISVDEIIPSAPEIETFSPTQSTIGGEIVITGNHMNDVTAATIGGQPVEIMQKVSNSRLSLRVTDNAKSGPITLSNPTGTGISEQSVTIVYIAPEPSAAGLPLQAELNDKLLISGKNMNVISAVVFTAEGYTDGHEAEVITQNNQEIAVRIPYVETDNANISLRYFDGNAYQSVPVAQMRVISTMPVVSTTSFSTAQISDVITLNGVNLDKVNSVKLGNLECSIKVQQPDELQFFVPASDTWNDGENIVPLSIIYFDGQGETVVTDHFSVYVPEVYLWTNRTLWGQSRKVPEFVSFFSPETGIAYNNSLWRTDVDPVAYRLQEKTNSDKNKPAVSEEEYNSVNPYFFFAGMSAGTLQLTAPSASATLLKNIYFYDNSANDYRVTGQNANCYGTPAISFLYLDPADAGHKALIDDAKAGKIERIDESTFPINTTDKTCRGINISNLRQTINNTVYANGVFEVGVDSSADIDAWILMVYYNVNGEDTTNRSLNIKRIGIIHFTHVDWKMNPGSVTPSASSVSFDMYWQKHDYDYNKVK